MKFLKGFVYAFRGIIYTLTNERNMRVHLVVAAYTLFFAQFYNMSSERWALLVLTISAVFALEMVNTAVERICDMYSKEQDMRIKAIKDVAAGAVLVSAVGAVFIGVFLFWNTDTILSIIYGICRVPANLTMFILTLVISILFIAIGPKGMLENARSFFKKKK